MSENEAQLAALKKLREPFDKSLISKLPKPTKAQTEEVKKNFKSGTRCAVCGGWHHPKVVHLDYVGHAALTSRLLDVDPLWNWEPFAVDDNGSPKLDKDGGMWIKLTVCGFTRLGYGDAEGKSGASATKERIGDALRNAAMRFGAALDLWSKADLTKPSENIEPDEQPDNSTPEQKQEDPRAKVESGLSWIDGHVESSTSASLDAGWRKHFIPRKDEFSAEHWNELTIAYKDTMKLLIEADMAEGAK